MMRFRLAGLITISVMVLAGCESQGLRQVDRPGDGPDEFLITPGLPLQEPADFASLPAPTPGGSNLTDQNPEADSVAALGGRAPVDRGAVPATDGAVVNYASRFGVEAGIRQSLAATDEEFRKRKARFTRIRLRPIDRYNQAYSDFALNPDRELRRWRRAGARTPSAPPPGQ